MIEKKDRIIFIDLLRAYAVIMMVQGHTIELFLSDIYRDQSNTIYYYWNYMRSFTAPIFIFSSGIIFTYLLKSVKKDTLENPRVKKGIKRFIVLVLTGYAIRLPRQLFTDPWNIKADAWFYFFQVDILHMIGFSILTVMILYYIAEKIKVKGEYLIVPMIIFLFIFYLCIEYYNIGKGLPLYISNYLNHDNGSNFPLVPWMLFFLIGALFGNYIIGKMELTHDTKFALKILIIGVIIHSLGKILSIWEYRHPYEIEFIIPPSMFIRRISVLFLTTSAVLYIAIKLKDIPYSVKALGKNSFFVYIFHIIILYGTPLNSGLKNYIGRNFNILESILLALGMIILMMVSSIIYDKTKSSINLAKKR